MTSKANLLLQLSLLLLVIQQKVFTNGLYEADYYELYYDLPNEDIKNKLLDDFKLYGESLKVFIVSENIRDS